MTYILIYWNKTTNKPRPYIDSKGYLRTFTDLNEADELANELEEIQPDWECRVISMDGVKE